VLIEWGLTRSPRELSLGRGARGRLDADMIWRASVRPWPRLDGTGPAGWARRVVGLADGGGWSQLAVVA